jgi:hypothetical protein
MVTERVSRRIESAYGNEFSTRASEVFKGIDVSKGEVDEVYSKYKRPIDDLMYAFRDNESQVVAYPILIDRALLGLFGKNPMFSSTSRGVDDFENYSMFPLERILPQVGSMNLNIDRLHNQITNLYQRYLGSTLLSPVHSYAKVLEIDPEKLTTDKLKANAHLKYLEMLNDKSNGLKVLGKSALSLSGQGMRKGLELLFTSHNVSVSMRSDLTPQELVYAYACQNLMYLPSQAEGTVKEESHTHVA